MSTLCEHICELLYEQYKRVTQRGELNDFRMENITVAHKKLKQQQVTPSIDTPDESDGMTISNTFPIIGIGASAGGLAAFEAFFSGIPKGVNPQCAFVLIQHLSPDHNSILCEIIRRYTTMKVFEVEDGMVVQPNCVYIIPPNHNMALINGALQLFDLSKSASSRMPIDFFFRSLAQDQRHRAIGIILSGTGSDGTQGIIAIKDEGGMIMVQTLSSAEYDGMPSSALATGLVDYELLPKEMASQLLYYISHMLDILPHTLPTTLIPKCENSLKKIFILLRAQTGHDFSQYKPSTIHRRIDRRMSIQHIEDMDVYVKYLQKTPSEVQELFRDLLIGVTNFFRDTDAFKVLEEKIIPKLFEGKAPGSTIRIWSCGCSSGEEAYSIAILLQERMDILKQSFVIQIFATDIDERAIAIARTGLYMSNMIANISHQRLMRFFTMDADGATYRIRKNIRDMIIFSEQDVIKDPPFSKLDLISCRNILIYMGSELQKRIIPLFHYALNPKGILFLGTSEGIGEFGYLFEELDRKLKIYQSTATINNARRRMVNEFIPLNITLPTRFPLPITKSIKPLKLPLRELIEEALLRHLEPSAILVNAEGDILYLYGQTGAYLELPSGEIGTNNILKMAREGLRREVTIALHKASTTQESVHCPALSIKTNDHFSMVDMTIKPLSSYPIDTINTSLYLIILENILSKQEQKKFFDSMSNSSEHRNEDADDRILALKQELIAKDEYIKTTHDELKTSNEDLKSSNEEMQSINEELQSTNEELETSKEEMQSLNEELSSVNAELQTKVLDLSRANNDMNNLLAGTGIATLFVDYTLRILRFTPSAKLLINVILSDIGRPVGHIVSNLVGYNSLQTDVQTVLDTLVPKEIKVCAITGQWYMMRIMPYRTLDNVIEGAVITFVNITEIMNAQESLRHLAIVINDAYDAITVQNLKGDIIAWNRSATRMYGWSEAEALMLNVSARIPENLREEEIEKLYQLSHNEMLQPCLTKRLTKDGTLKDVWITATALVDDAGNIYAISTTERLGELGKDHSS